MNKRNLVRAGIALTLLVTGFAICRSSYASEEPGPGDQCRIVRPVYLMAVYNSLNDRRLSRETARAYVHSVRYYDKAEVAFQREVPAGTIMTIIGPAPKVWHLPFFANRYFVRLDPDLARGLDVVLELTHKSET